MLKEGLCTNTDTLHAPRRTCSVNRSRGASTSTQQVQRDNSSCIPTRSPSKDHANKSSNLRCASVELVVPVGWILQMLQDTCSDMVRFHFANGGLDRLDYVHSVHHQGGSRLTETRATRSLPLPVSITSKATANPTDRPSHRSVSPSVGHPAKAHFPFRQATHTSHYTKRHQATKHLTRQAATQPS